MDNTSGERNDRIQTTNLFHTCCRKKHFCNVWGVLYIWQSVQKKPFQKEELRGQTFCNFKHVSVSCNKWCVYKKYTYGLSLGLWKQCLNGTTCKVIHFWRKIEKKEWISKGAWKRELSIVDQRQFAFIDVFKMLPRQLLYSFSSCMLLINVNQRKPFKLLLL
jgi:hypothetical protein